MLDRPNDRPRFNTKNKGNHIIHIGGKYDSYLLILVIPAKK